jgi:hypothetical protein
MSCPEATAPTPKTHPRRRPPRRCWRDGALLLGLALLLAMLWGATDYLAARLRAEICLEAVQNARLLATAAQNSFRRTLVLSRALAAVAQEWSNQNRAHLAFADSHRRMAEMAHEPLFGLNDIWVADAAGSVTEASNPKALGLNIANRPYFRLLAAGGDEPVFSRLQEAGNPGALVIGFPLHEAGGGFAGVAAVRMDPWVIYRQLAAVTARPEVSAALFQRSTGRLLARTPVEPARFPALETALRGRPEMQPGPVATDGVSAEDDSVVAWSGVAGTDLVAEVQMPRAVAEAGAAGSIALLRGAAAALSVTLVLGAAVIVLARRRREAMAERDRAISVYGELLRLLDGAPVGQITSAAELPLESGTRRFALGMIRSEAEVKNQPLSYGDGGGTARILGQAPEL